MTDATKYKDLSSGLPVSPHYRIAGHMLLILAVVFIAGQGIGDNLSHRCEELSRTGIILCVLLGIIYTNIYVLTPRFLFKNRLVKYALSLFGIIFTAILLISVSQVLVVIPRRETGVETPAGFILLNLASVIIQFGLLVAGTSTVLLFRQWITNEYRINALKNATVQSELEQLKNQINPHFLFNMLNNANVLVKKNPNEAALVLSKLKDLLKYQINDSSREQVALKADIQFLTDFLNLEKIRRDKFEFIISTAGDDVSRTTVPPLLFIPFVENAVKHNNDSTALSYVHLYFEVVNDSLLFVCSNSKPDNPQPDNRRGGLGLANIKRRLELLYSSDYTLDIIENEAEYEVALVIPMEAGGKAEGRRQKAESRRQKAKGRKQKAESKRQKVRSRKWEVGEKVNYKLK
jgi:sensor histidine kinase YesM